MAPKAKRRKAENEVVVVEEPSKRSTRMTSKVKSAANVVAELKELTVVEEIKEKVAVKRTRSKKVEENEHNDKPDLPVRSRSTRASSKIPTIEVVPEDSQRIKSKSTASNKDSKIGTTKLVDASENVEKVTRSRRNAAVEISQTVGTSKIKETNEDKIPKKVTRAKKPSVSEDKPDRTKTKKSPTRTLSEPIDIPSTSEVQPPVRRSSRVKSSPKKNSPIIKKPVTKKLTQPQAKGTKTVPEGNAAKSKPKARAKIAVSKKSKAEASEEEESAAEQEMNIANVPESTKLNQNVEPAKKSKSNSLNPQLRKREPSRRSARAVKGTTDEPIDIPELPVVKRTRKVAVKVPLEPVIELESETSPVKEKKKLGRPKKDTNKSIEPESEEKDATATTKPEPILSTVIEVMESMKDMIESNSNDENQNAPPEQGNSVDSASEDGHLSNEIEEIKVISNDSCEDNKETTPSEIEPESKEFVIDVDAKTSSDEDDFKLSIPEDSNANMSESSVCIDDTMDYLQSSSKRKADFDDNDDDDDVIEIIKKPRTVLPVPQLGSIRGHFMTFGEDGTACGCMSIRGKGANGFKSNKPVFSASLTEILVSTATGPYHTVVLNNEGNILTFGMNDDCALGREIDEDGDDTYVGADPEEVPLDVPTKFVRISAGDSHCVALDENGSVYAWGTIRNTNGSYGMVPDSKEPCKRPKVIINHNDMKIIDIASGSNHILVLNEEREVYSFGAADQGQLGRINQEDIDYKEPDLNESQTEEEIAEITEALQERRHLCLTPQLVKFDDENVRIVNIWAGECCSFARTESGDIFAWGLNNYCQLGFKGKGSIEIYPKKLAISKNITEISSGIHHSLLLDSDGCVYSCGRYDYGRLGHGEVKGSVPVDIDSNVNDKLEPTLIRSLQSERIKQVRCGNVSSFAVTQSGSLYSWGMRGPVLGLGLSSDDETSKDVYMPTKVSPHVLDNYPVLHVSVGNEYAVVLVEHNSRNGK